MEDEKLADEYYNLAEKYTAQMAENHMINIDKNFWLVVKQKPKYMPSWLYKMVVKELVVFHQYK